MPKPEEPVPPYLLPYHEARLNGAKGFNALLWSSREGQRIRFGAISRIFPLAGKRVLDVGCGQADLLGFLLEQEIRPAHYTGLEMIPASLRAARRRGYDRCEIRKGDFVRQPEKMQVDADVVIFSGSLNTVPHQPFYSTLRAAWAAAGRCLVFNFLESRAWCGEDWLHWYPRDQVLSFCHALGGEVRFDAGYLNGDCTIAVRRQDQPA